MIPPSDSRGYLPPGIHKADLAEVVARFGAESDLRRDQSESLEWLVPLCRSAGIIRLLINGSFVTAVAEPNDVDCVLLVGPDYNEYSEAAAELERGLPFLSLRIARQVRFDQTLRFFATDRGGMDKGIVEIIL